MSVPLIFCVDVEPDERLFAPGSNPPWRGFETALSILEAWRQRFADRSGRDAHLSWFVRVDPQVAAGHGGADWPLRRYRREIDDAAARGDSIGLHVHAYRWLDRRRAWLIDHADQQWIDACLSSSFDTYAKCLGWGCTTMRFGDRFMNTATMNTLESLGVRVDMTPEPLHPRCRGLDSNETSTGSLPDYSNLPHRPYTPAREDFLAASAEPRSITVLPMSSARLRREADGASTGAIAAALRSASTAEVVETANLARPHQRIAAVLDHALSQTASPYLAVVVRSGALADPLKRREIDVNLDHLLDLAAAGDLVMLSPEMAVAQLAASRSITRPAAPPVAARR